jgi:hypothetical protein
MSVYRMFGRDSSDIHLRLPRSRTSFGKAEAGPFVLRIDKDHTTLSQMTIYFAVAALVGLASALSLVTSNLFVAADGDTLKLVRAADRSDRSAGRWTVFDILAVAVMVTVSGLRYQVGTDFNLYYTLYNKLDPAHWQATLASSPQEVGYTGLSLALRGISDSPYLIFWVASALTIIPVYVTIKKQSVDPTMSLLLYVLLAFFVAPFNLVRQGIAISLNFWADSYLDHNKKAYLVINAVAASFHASVLLVVVIQFIARRCQSSVRLLTAVVIASMVAVLLYTRIGVFAVWLNTLNPRYDGYIVAQQGAGIGSYLIIAARLGLLLYVLTLARRSVRDQSIRRHTNYVIVGLFFLFLGTQSVVISRMELYFGMFLVLLIPNTLGARRAWLDKIVIVALAAVYLGFFLTNYANLIPYQTQL